MIKPIQICIFVFLILPAVILAGNSDTTTRFLEPVHKNVIKFNPTPMLLWSMKNVTFSYERVINPRQTLSVEIGFLELPRLISDTLAGLVKISSRWKQGLNLTFEYRFYLTRLNARPVPAGLYIGPYLTYYGYRFKNDFDILHASIDDKGMIQGHFWSFNLGAELGYQFVFGKRFTLDMVMLGPSMSYYGGSTGISGQLDPEQQQLIQEEIYNRLKEKFPGMQFIPANSGFKQTGKLDLFWIGFRYLVQVGFHF